MSNCAVLTVSNRPPKEPYYCYNGYIETARRFGLQPHILGEPKFRGLATKPLYVLRWLEAILPRPEYVMFSDCWDLLWEDNLDTILGKYKEFGSDVVVNAENNCFPLVELKEPFDALNISNAPYPYLNSGFYIGTYDAVRFMLEKSGAGAPAVDYQDPDGKWHHFEDQSPLQKTYLTYHRGGLFIQLDRYGHICNTMGGAEESHFDFSGPRVKNVLAGTFPSVWHANGGGKTTSVFTKIRQRLNV